MAANHYYGTEEAEDSSDQYFDSQLGEILNHLYDTSFPHGVSPNDFLQELEEDASAHNSAQAPNPTNHPLVVDPAPANEIYEDITPHVTPRSHISGDSGSTICQGTQTVEGEDSLPPNLSLPSRITETANIIHASRKGVKRLREIYGEGLIYPEKEEENSESPSVSSTTQGKKRIGKYSCESSNYCESPNSSEGDEQFPDEIEAQVFFESQDSVLNTINSERRTSDTSDEDERPFTPLFNARDLHGLSYAALRTANRSFQRVLEIATSPLTYHQTADIVSHAQSGIADLLHRLIDVQNQHTIDLRSAVEFFAASQERVLEENRQLRNTVLSLQQALVEVRNDHSMLITVLSLISERLNVIQRQSRNV